ncbi:MAG: LysM peptidoglycan-binding domain-containing protein [Anaerolineae bacterium]|nr:LysM peptidoglycan-binding domain-containing protein [Anaerolineae bacterium]
MRRTVIRISRLTLGLLFVALGATGCFQSVGAALLATSTPSAPTLEPQFVDATNTAVAQQQLDATNFAMVDAITQTAIAIAALPTETPSETPTETPFMPATDVSGNPFAPTSIIVPTTEVPPLAATTAVAVLGTWTPTTVFIVTANFTATPLPTFTPFPTQTPYPTQTPQPTYTPYPTQTPQPTYTPFPTTVSMVGTADISQNPIFNSGVSATPFIPTLDPALRPIQIAELPTQGPTVMIATLEPAVVAQEPTIDPAFLQATQIIAGITATAQANLDATFAAQGTPIAPPDQGGQQPPIQVTAPPGGIFITTTPQGTWGAPDSGASGPLGADGYYIVQAGDRMIRIALRFNTTVDAIARANGITNPDVLSPGQRLRIPGAVPTATVAPLQPSGSGGQVPGAITLAPGATLDPRATIIIITATPPGGSSASGQVYVVQEGDTLYGIATRFRVSVTALAQYNGISNISVIYIGQRLTIP